MGLKPIADEYLEQTHRVKPGDRLHRLVARMADMHIDDLSEDRILELEEKVDSWRWMNANCERI